MDKYILALFIISELLSLIEKWNTLLQKDLQILHSYVSLRFKNKELHLSHNNNYSSSYGVFV